MEKIRVRHQRTKNIYVHNDLLNAAYHFKTQIESRLKLGDRAGIAFEYMACLIFLAFAFEAMINFLGHKLISGWNERQSFSDKMTEVFNHLKINPDWTVRPYSSISALKKFRDLIAHGKPAETTSDEEIMLSKDEIDRRIDLDSEWVPYCSHDNVFNTFTDIDVIWKQLLQISRLKPYETITRGEIGLTYIEPP